ncbi:MAG: UDP-N-acetylmuramoyl-L-alanyl-D-glutamate--2,6-diaminopimelate ligase, partial [Eubacteriales bacterium]|nr:UDP-N-acetylmuramoyl-L-alanyl-D-glutamate--2,6-diaminopimelate ligase [Eubacteriales bacterium]
MKLADLCDGMHIIGNSEVDITSVEYDSRKVSDGALFFCISGYKTDGHTYAGSAVENGAAALMVTRALDIDVPQILVDDARMAMAHISRVFYGKPDEAMTMIGLTGTNGKTTTTYMIKSVLEASGKKTGLIGTILNMIGRQEIATERTTPESPDLFALLGRMADEGCVAVVMEVSSHSLSLDRVAGIVFDVSVFTNLTQDHLDFHETFENYKAAKKKLFFMSKRAAVNIDDGAAAYMMEDIDIDWRTYGIKEKADVYAKNIEITPRGVTYDLCCAQAMLPLALGIPGIFSVYNSLAAATACLILNESLETIKTGLEAMPGVAGRFEVLETGDRPYTIILDYAHTPDSLENTLLTVKSFARGRIIPVFGCGGDRDKGKRPIMGEIAGRLSTFAVITSDNPRTEDPYDIISAVESGMKKTDCPYICIENRREAIKYAIDNALPGDIIILAGKGHETYQEVGSVKYPLDEKIVVNELLNK